MLGIISRRMGNLLVYVGASTDKFLHDFGVASADCVMLDEKYAQLIVLTCNVERCPISTVRSIHIGFLVNEEADDIQGAGGRGPVHRSPFILA